MNRGLMALVMLLLAGCSVLPPAKPVRLYRLPPVMVTPASGTELDGLRLARPGSTGALSGNRLLVLTGEHAYQAYGDARWASPLPQLWQDWLLDALWQDGRITGLSAEETGLPASWELAGTLRAFEVELNESNAEAVIRFDAQLLRTDDRRIVASRRFEQRQVLNGRSASEAVAALGLAASRLAPELSDWLLSSARGAAQ